MSGYAANKPTNSSAAQVRLKSIALPVEHGGWMFVLEPVLLGLLVAPSAGGWWLGVAALGIFLLNQPLKFAIKDRLRGRRYPRTAWAERFALLYGALVGVAALLARLTARAPFWPSILLAIPFAALQVASAATNRGRDLLPEISGAVALAAAAPAIALAGGWSLTAALLLWLVPVARAVASILYVRARLRLERGEPANRGIVFAAHGFGLLLLGGLAWLRLIPWLAAVAMAILLVRALLGLSAHRRPVRAQVVGFQELGFGLLTVALAAVGYRLF
jgi:hypothetical protein